MALAKGPFQASLLLLDAVSQTPLIGIAADLCRKLDVDCSAPLASASASDAAGMLSFNVDRGFDGYVSLMGASIAPTLYFFNPPVTANTGRTAVSVSSPTVMKLFAQQIGAELSPDRGVIILSAVDCQGNAAEGVSYSTTSGDETTLSFYAVGQLPTTKAQATDRSGFGGLVNVPPGVVTVTGVLAADGSKVGTLSLLARGGTVTYTRMVPLVD